MNSFKFVIDGWVFFGCDFIFLFTKNNDFIFILNSYYCILNIQMTSYRNYSKTQKIILFLLYTVDSRQVLEDLYNFFYVVYSLEIKQN